MLQEFARLIEQTTGCVWNAEEWRIKYVCIETTINPIFYLIISKVVAHVINLETQLLISALTAICCPTSSQKQKPMFPTEAAVRDEVGLIQTI